MKLTGFLGIIRCAVLIAEKTFNRHVTSIHAWHALHGYSLNLFRKRNYDPVTVIGRYSQLSIQKHPA
ncbi:hypothetical protein ABMA09_26200 (plasmid) [Erwinia rhapontici]